MRIITKRLAVLGSSLCAVAALSAPSASTALAESQKPLTTVAENAAVNVQTEYNCNTHLLTAEVRNKLGMVLNPTVRFDKKMPLMPSEQPIEPGMIANFDYGFSGNGSKVAVTVAVDGYGELKVEPSLNCSEPVSFTVTEASTHTIVGYLTNNSSLYPQTVILRAGFNGPETRVSLQPGESTLVSAAYDAPNGAILAPVLVTNGPNYESTYLIDLTQPIMPPPGTDGH